MDFLYHSRTNRTTLDFDLFQGAYEGGEIAIPLDLDRIRAWFICSWFTC